MALKNWGCQKYFGMICRRETLLEENWSGLGLSLAEKTEQKPWWCRAKN